jgi:hypothetical protein
MKEFLSIFVLLTCLSAQAEINPNFLGKFTNIFDDSDISCPAEITIKLNVKDKTINALNNGTSVLSLKLDNKEGYNQSKTYYFWNSNNRRVINNYEYYVNSVGEMNFSYSPNGEKTKVERRHLHMFARNYDDNSKHDIFIDLVTGYYSVPYSPNDTLRNCKYYKSLSH